MRFNADFLLPYMAAAPLALAWERVLECRIYSMLAFERPILDVGCGDGLFARMLFAERVDTGIDPNPRELVSAQRLAVYDEVLQCAGDSIPRPDGSYRTIFSNSVLEHIEDIEPVLRELRRLLAPGGQLYITVPSQYFEEYNCVNQVLAALGLTAASTRWKSFFNSFWQHYHTHSPAGWEGVLGRAGFRVVTSFTYDPKPVCLLNDFLVPFSGLSLLTKKLFNRWTLFPGVRSALFYPMLPAVRGVLAGGEKATDGGLVFVSATRD